MVQTTCICGELDGDKVDEMEGIAILKCRCGQTRTAERPADYQRLYTEGDEYHRKEMDLIGRDHYDARLPHDVKLGHARLDKLLSQQRLLDVGCANGGFLKAAKERGFAVTGIELNPGMADFAADAVGCNVYTSWQALSDSEDGWAPYDVVTLHDVFEHVVSPLYDLGRIRGVMDLGGRLVLDCPDASTCVGAVVTAPQHRKPRQHLWWHTHETLAELLNLSGFLVDHVDYPIPGKVVVYGHAV